jgi:DNA-binding CsgD family transcriptional regulator
MGEVGNAWRGLKAPGSSDDESLLCPGAVPGQFGASTGASLFSALAGPRRHVLHPQPGLHRTDDDGDTPEEKTSPETQQPMFMVDGEKKMIRLRNASGAALLARRDLVLEHHGMLACRDVESDRRLTMAMRSVGGWGANGAAAEARERCAVWLRRADGRGAAATLHALRDGSDSPGRAKVLITVFEPGKQPDIDPHVLVLAYGLTSAEARLAAMIAQGRETGHCARELEVKTSTLRSHLSAIYRKTGATGKADLVRLVLALCAI